MQQIKNESLPQAQFIWRLIGNIIEGYYSEKDNEVKYGTKHFGPGTKVYCLPPQWGDGYEHIRVIGKHRGSRRSACMVTPSKYITNWRLQKVYRTFVHNLMQHHHSWTDREKDKELILQMLEWLPERTIKNAADAMWQLKNEWAVGGLLEAGFQTGTDLLMVLSGQGRGIFDCLSGTQIARDTADFYAKHWDDCNGIVEGFGPLEGIPVTCGGFEYPNVLEQSTIDGWEIKRFRGAGQ